MFDYETINAIVQRYDPMRIDWVDPNEYEPEVRDLLKRFLDSKKTYSFKHVQKEVINVFTHFFSDGPFTEGSLENIAHAIWDECFNGNKKLTPAAIARFQREQQEYKNQPVEKYPTQKLSPYRWIAPHLDKDGVSPRFPPHKAEPRRPLLWLVNHGQQAWLVNFCSAPLRKVVISHTGLGGGDEHTCAYNGKQDWIYHDILPGRCILVDEWDGFYDLDFYLSCEFNVDVPLFGEMNFRAGGTMKGRIETQVLLWDTHGIGKKAYDNYYQIEVE